MEVGDNLQLVLCCPKGKKGFVRLLEQIFSKHVTQNALNQEHLLN